MVHAFEQNNLVVDTDLIRRFDVNGPRYTSYPTADRFEPNFSGDHYLQVLRHIPRQPLSLYVHIPFCQTICYYCGCNKIITKDHGRSAKYIQYLKRDIAMQCYYLLDKRQVIQLHWGGGTPTFLSAEEMNDLMSALTSAFEFLPEGEYSIEVDPRKVCRADVFRLAHLGFNRMSIGVQDFDPAVQKAVNRLQSLEETRDVLIAAREAGFMSVSLDLIYGLPKQTLDSFTQTLDAAIALDPDRLSVYNYAHLPSVFMPQRRIDVNDLPTAECRLELLKLAINRLTQAGYVFIGMDHFAKPNDELAVAQRQGRLHRNFQGYSTYAECNMLSFGISAISDAGNCYAQNVKTLDEYYQRLDQNISPVMRGFQLNTDDVIRKSLIQTLMCHFMVDKAGFSRQFDIDFDQYFQVECEDLCSLVAAGLVALTPQQIIVLPAGRLLVRAVAMIFDRYLREKKTGALYSKVI